MNTLLHKQCKFTEINTTQVSIAKLPHPHIHGNDNGNKDQRISRLYFIHCWCQFIWKICNKARSIIQLRIQITKTRDKGTSEFLYILITSINNDVRIIIKSICSKIYWSLRCSQHKLSARPTCSTVHCWATALCDKCFWNIVKFVKDSCFQVLENWLIHVIEKWSRNGTVKSTCCQRLRNVWRRCYQSGCTLALVQLQEKVQTLQ